MKRLYSPPPGYFDLPFTWAFDASGLVNGTNALNQSVYLIGGYGDFILRRIVGLNRFLSATTGQFQIGRASRGSYIQSDPVFAANSPELSLPNEEWYPETGKIWFDLYGINLPDAPLTAQLAFQGIRRQKGTFPKQPAYKNTPKTFTYQVQATITQLAAATTPVITFTKIVDYDFELYDMIILAQTGGTAASLTFSNEGAALLTFTAAAAGISGNNISIFINPAADINLPLSISVIGNAVSVALATDGFGSPTLAMTGAFVAAALAATPAFVALASVVATAGGGPACPTSGGNPPFFLHGGTGGGPQIITDPVSALWVYDQNRVQISNMPILDIFYNGGPGTPYQNGAVVPPLFYKQNTTIEIDFYSEVTNPADLPVTVTVLLVGRQFYPC